MHNKNIVIVNITGRHYKDLYFFARYAKPISVARRVLENSSANILVGEGATQFAREQQFPLEDNDSLLTPETKQAYEVRSISLYCNSV